MTRTHSLSSALAGSILLMALPFGSGCAPDGTPPSLEWQSPTPQGALRGELAVYTADLYDGTTEVKYALRVDGNPRDERPLRFQYAPDLPSGVWLDVWGHEESGQWVVSRYEKTPGQNLEPTRQALIGAPRLKTRSIAFVLVDLGAGVNLTSEAALKRVVGTNPGDDSVRQYFTEASFGRLDVTAKVFGPLKTTISGCTVNGIPNELRSQIPGTFDQYFWYMGKQVAACGWSGLAMVGSPDRPARDTWFNGTSGCTVLVHEPGHNLGLKHASSMKCGADVFVDEPNGKCTHSEYGDSTDAMGSSCRHMNVYTKTYQEWFGRCNMVDVTSSGTFTLLPIELPCDGIQGLQIAMPKTRPFHRSGGGGSAGITNLTHYYIELRTPTGFDGRHGNTAAMNLQVQIRVSGDIRQRRQSGYNTWILDMVPSTRTLDGLGAGGTFKDPAGGITFTVEALSATGATVRVEIAKGTGAPTCMDGTTIELPGPGPESCAAGPAVPDKASPARDGGSLVEPRTDGGRDTASGAEVPPLDVGARDTRTPLALMDASQDTRRDDSSGANADVGSAYSADIREEIGSSTGAGGRTGTGAGGAGGDQTGEMSGTSRAPERQDADSQTYTTLPKSGCSCRFPGTPGPNGPGVSLLVLALALGWAGRQRRR